jgi:hypothetical protein
MRKLGIIAVLSLMALALAAVPALAAKGSPHFIKNATTASLSGTNLTVSFKETGLPAGSVQTVVASADASATYSCVNNGQNIPADPKKTTVNSRVEASGEFTANRSGNIVGTLTLSPPPSNLDCPPGQTTTLIDVTYSNVTVQDLDSGAFLALRGIFSA